VICFFNTKNICPVETHCQLVEMYGEGVMNDGNVRNWCVICLMEEGQICTMQCDLDIHLPVS
jgi:hypothetical protein